MITLLFQIIAPFLYYVSSPRLLRKLFSRKLFNLYQTHLLHINLDFYLVAPPCNSCYYLLMSFLMPRKQQDVVIYLDFKKAFDSVSHCKLLLKLRSYGIAGKLFNWFKAYLTNRHQYVRINDSCSESLPVLSGVPQGSILGPLFFVLFINDLPNCLKSSLPFIFADDTKCLKHTINSDISEVDLLQEDLNNTFHWSINNDLSFNFAKFVHIQFWSRTTLDTSNTTFKWIANPSLLLSVLKILEY